MSAARAYGGEIDRGAAVVPPALRPTICAPSVAGLVFSRAHAAAPVSGTRPETEKSSDRSRRAPPTWDRRRMTSPERCSESPPRVVLGGRTLEALALSSAVRGEARGVMFA
jgi:hypothetical protein